MECRLIVLSILGCFCETRAAAALNATAASLRKHSCFLASGRTKISFLKNNGGGDADQVESFCLVGEVKAIFRSTSHTSTFLSMQPYFSFATSDFCSKLIALHLPIMDDLATKFLYNMGQSKPLFCLFSFFSPSGIKLGSFGPESAALSTRPPPWPQVFFLCSYMPAQSIASASILSNHLSPRGEKINWMSPGLNLGQAEAVSILR